MSPPNISRRFAMLILTDDPALQLRAARSATRHATAQVSPLSVSGSTPARRAPAAGFRLLRLSRSSRWTSRSSACWSVSIASLRRCLSTPSAPSDRVRSMRASRAQQIASSHLGFGSGDALARSIRGDAVDVLFDLNGYSELQMLEAFARRPAADAGQFSRLYRHAWLQCLRLHPRRQLLHPGGGGSAGTPSAFCAWIRATCRRIPRAKSRQSRCAEPPTGSRTMPGCCAASHPPTRSCRIFWTACNRSSATIRMRCCGCGTPRRTWPRAFAPKRRHAASRPADRFRPDRRHRPLPCPLPARRSIRRHVSLRRTHDRQ